MELKRRCIARVEILRCVLIVPFMELKHFRSWENYAVFVS